MSDLQCPATVLVMPHAHATPEVPGVLGDQGGCLSELGVAQTQALAHGLRADPSLRLASVLTSTSPAAVQTARLVAHLLGLVHERVDGVEEVSVGELVGQPVGSPRMEAVLRAWKSGDLGAAVPGGEDGRSVVGRFRLALEDIADGHRGQGCLVVTHPWIMGVALPWLCDNARPDLALDQVLPPAVPARVLIDADGWVLDDWPGRAAAGAV